MARIPWVVIASLIDLLLSTTSTPVLAAALKACLAPVLSRSVINPLPFCFFLRFTRITHVTPRPDYFPDRKPTSKTFDDGIPALTRLDNGILIENKFSIFKGAGHVMTSKGLSYSFPEFYRTLKYPPNPCPV
jgi:hypothetical protein